MKKTLLKVNPFTRTAALDNYIWRALFRDVHHISNQQSAVSSQQNKRSIVFGWLGGGLKAES